MGFLIRLIATALGLGLAAYMLPGVHVDGVGTMLIAALLLGIVNAVVKPVLVLLTLPVTILTLGLFLFILNAAMLGLVAWMLPGFALAGFWSALGAWFIVTVVGWAASRLT